MQMGYAKGPSRGNGTALDVYGFLCHHGRGVHPESTGTPGGRTFGPLFASEFVGAGITTVEDALGNTSAAGGCPTRITPDPDGT